MKKMLAIITMLASSLALSLPCFADVTRPANANEVAKVMKALIKNHEISKGCIQESKDNPSEAIRVTQMEMDIDGAINEIYQVESLGGSCCMGAGSTCAMWVYKKNKWDAGVIKIFGPEYPETLMFLTNQSSNWISDMVVIYPDGNFGPGINETYKFNGKKYILAETKKRPSRQR